jgi:hypothetical protein
MGQQVNVYRKLKFYPGAIVEGSWNGSFDRGGKTYYVNNITGSSSADGLSWDGAFDQVSTAITASEASRLIHVGTTTNDYIRNTIVVQGTGTAYASLTALPSYCDMIGLGADPRGNGTGIARIGPDADTTPSDGINADAARGLNMYNIQVQAASAKYGMDIDKAYRCLFENMAFMQHPLHTSSSALLELGLMVEVVW